VHSKIGGKDFMVSIDTGSSDLWVEGIVPAAKNTGVLGEITYAKGSARGPIMTSDVQFAGYTIQDQPFSES
jgi:hypothetical protein